MIFQDVHTSRWVVNKCFKGDLLKGRTIILVVRTTTLRRLVLFLSPSLQTHNVALTAPLAKFILSMGPNGTVQSKGAPVDILGENPELEKEVTHEAAALELDEEEDDVGETATADPKEGKLIIAEEIAIGRVGRSACV